MSAGRPASIQVSRKGRKKSSKKEDTLSGLPQENQCSPSVTSFNTCFPLVMDSSLSEEEVCDSDMPLDNRESCFPFQDLPDLCKIKIWSFLKQCDLGRSMLVCRSWHKSISNPQWWNVISLNELPYTCLPRDRNGPTHTEPVCHHCFRKRLFSFSAFLSRLRPIVKKFQFCLDISHPTDQFYTVVERFLLSADLKSLTYADINWKESPSRSNLRTVNEPSQDILYRCRQRQRMFFRMFQDFVNVATQLTTLIMPFDWTEPNVENLCKLVKLENLVLEKYGTYNHTFTQEHMNKLTKSLVHLKKLLLQVSIPTGDSVMRLYQIESASLVVLDVSLCCGFYLQRITTPNLLKLRILPKPLKRNFFQQQTPEMPCMFSVLSVGAAQLKNINGHILEMETIDHPSIELSNLLSTLCWCPKHKTSGGKEMYGM
ncbi:hypothetical protein Bpfe_012650 [Biomphalaria pfeifferi]|uniref:F-box domain-containing protein n=1 Tax=Biomphalaria pfeifferi TaxID=112525 RepID=A0AAD8BQ91_BIOPF|nr:hypothetical protein Bpfe_012650 [Biomphalaria pfeifferi]